MRQNTSSMGESSRSRRTRLALLVTALCVVVPAVIGWALSRSRHQRLFAELTRPSAARTTLAPLEPWFEEAAARAGLHFIHASGARGGFSFPEIMCGGAAFLDHDGDGWLDVYLVQAGGTDAPGGGANRLFQNKGDGSFELVTGHFAPEDSGYGMGVAVGDFDGDGDEDLYVTNVGPDVLYRNDGGGEFRDVTVAAGIDSGGWGASAAFVDHDADGDLDLFVVNYIGWSTETEIECTTSYGERDYCSPLAYQRPALDRLYENLGGGEFRDVTLQAGLGGAYGNGLGVVCLDADGDGLVDIYVANDGTPNQLWLNRGDGTFQDRALEHGCAVNAQGSPEAGMGVIAFDADGDGERDLFMTHLRDETNTLYTGRDGQFEVSSRSALGESSRPFTGFGVGSADFDHDGRMDVYVANGDVSIHPPVRDPADPFAQPDHLFRGLAGGAFEEIGLGRGATDGAVRTSRAVALGDHDGDGDIDVLVVDRDASVRLLVNRVGSPNPWLQLRVLGRDGNDALGARVRVDTSSGPQYRWVSRAGGYCASKDPRVHFGIPDDAVTGLTILWPDGEEDDLPPPQVSRLHIVRRR